MRQVGLPVAVTRTVSLPVKVVMSETFCGFDVRLIIAVRAAVGTGFRKVSRRDWWPQRRHTIMMETRSVPRS